MVIELSPSSLDQIEVFSRWNGFAHPPSRVEKLVISREGDGFVCEEEIARTRGALPVECVRQFLNELCRPPVEALDPKLFDVPEPVIRRHFGSMWTDDNPRVLLRLKFAGGRNIDVLTTGQHVCLLPIQVRDAHGILNHTTFQPALSRAMASIMPSGFFQRNRLEGTRCMLEQEIDDYRKGLGIWQTDPAAATEPSEAKQSEEAVLPSKMLRERMQERLLRIHMRIESPEEKQIAERTGKVSQRLLKRLPPDEIAEILHRGGDPNVADENGQTALMLAAFPPLDRMAFRMLVRGGANLEARRTTDGATGLHLACKGGMSETVEEWILAGADVHARVTNGATPLMLGAGWLPIVRLLLAGGARVNEVDEDGHTALVYAIHAQRWFQADERLAAIRLLLEGGTDLTLRDREGLTPLGFSQRFQRSKLLEREADRAVRESSGRRPTREEEQAKADLMKKLLRESYPQADPDRWNDLTMAEAVVALISQAGGID